MRSNDQSVQLEAQVQHENLIECLQQNSLKQGAEEGKSGEGHQSDYQNYQDCAKVAEIENLVYCGTHQEQKKLINAT
jgi:hypothetical protein